MTDDERHALAGEYVLGLLPESERAAVERDLARDFELAGAVAGWQDRLLPLAGMPPPVEPSRALWARIERTLQRDTATARSNWWSSLALWRAVSAAALAACIVLGVQLASPPPLHERYLAVLQSSDRTAGWIVEAEAGGAVRLVPLGATEVPPDRALQFWTKAESASAPTSLGLVPGDRPTQIDAALLPALEPNQLFELTLEPPTGSPTGRPTGPVLFVGRTVALR
jgi:anti-sigma-K factor RskA